MASPFLFNATKTNTDASYVYPLLLREARLEGSQETQVSWTPELCRHTQGRRGNRRPSLASPLQESLRGQSREAVHPGCYLATSLLPSVRQSRWEYPQLFFISVNKQVSPSSSAGGMSLSSQVTSRKRQIHNIGRFQRSNKSWQTLYDPRRTPTPLQYPAPCRFGFWL